MAHGGELTPSATAYPLNSRRLTAHVFTRIAKKLELPTTAPLADLRQIVEGRLAEGGHEATNVEVLVAQSELGSTITLRDEEGVFLEVHPEEEERLSDGRGSPREREGREADVDSRGEDEGAAVIEAHEAGGARTDPASPTARARAREEELVAELETARQRVAEMEFEMERLQEAHTAETLRLQSEVSKMEEKVKREKERCSTLWRINCERLVEHDRMISLKDEEVSKLETHIRDLESRSPVHVSHAPTPDHSADSRVATSRPASAD